MMKVLYFLGVGVLLTIHTFGQGNQTAGKSASEIDHQKMMDLLHLTTLQPGGCANNPTYYNEEKANPYPDIGMRLTGQRSSHLQASILNRISSTNKTLKFSL